MYSVLIFNEETKKSFEKFKPLFVDEMRAGNLGVCEWKDSESTIEDALPQLYHMIGDKKEWRAIVVQSYLENTEKQYVVDSRNPFDYIENRNEYNKAVEAAKVWSEDSGNRIQVEADLNMKSCSTIPLVILSQMLGGVPKHTPRFYDFKPSYVESEKGRNTLSSLSVSDAIKCLQNREKELKKELAELSTNIGLEDDKLISEKDLILGQIEQVKSDIERLIQERAQAKKSIELYDVLEKKYTFHANRPRELLFVAVRTKQSEALEKLKEAWANYDEIQSSLFWAYNHYSERTRFISYEIEKKGSVQLQGDMLKLWLAIGILANNHLDPSSFQATFLYNMSISLDNEKMAESFRDMAFQLDSAKQFLKVSMARDRERYINDQLEAPGYKVNVNVSLDDRRIKEPTVVNSDFGLVSENNNTDSWTWKESCEAVDSFLHDLRRIIGRAVEDSAQKMRGNCKFEPEEVDPMTDFQSKEFSDQLSETYQDVLSGQTMLKFGEEVELRQRKLEEEKIVSSILRERLTSGRVRLGYRITLIATFIAIFPAVVRAYISGVSVFIPVFGALGFASSVYLLATFLFCKNDRRILSEKIANYLNVLSALKNLMRTNALAYGAFLSSVGSHMKGSSYINILRHKEYCSESIAQRKRHHLEEIRNFKRILEEWAKSVYLPSERIIPDTDTEIEFDEMDIPNFYSLYSLEFGQSYQIPFNNSGMLTARYSFITGLSVVREDLYDDNIFGGDSD